MDEILIIKGIEAFDDVSKFGLPMAQRISNAVLVIGIDDSGQARILKERVPGDHLPFFTDVSSDTSEFVDTMNSIKSAWEQIHPSQDSHLGHCAVGMWLFYWVHGPTMKTPAELIREKRWDLVKATAQEFIDCDFGKRAPGNIGSDVKRPPELDASTS